jgi:hypothetical protein
VDYGDQNPKRRNLYFYTNRRGGGRLVSTYRGSGAIAQLAAIRADREREGVPLTAIATVMGHASIQTTERYAHATDEGTRRVVEALQKKQPLVTIRSQEERRGLYDGKLLYLLMGRAGIEPATLGLRVPCSTD